MKFAANLCELDHLGHFFKNFFKMWEKGHDSCNFEVYLQMVNLYHRFTQLDHVFEKKRNMQ